MFLRDKSAVLFEAHCRSLLSVFKPSDAIERGNWEARKAAFPIMGFAFVGLALEAFVGGYLWVIPATVGGMVLIVFVVSRAGRLRVTETHLEVRGFLRRKRILRSRIAAVVFDTYIQESRYFSQEERLAIFLESGGRALGHITQRQWGREVLRDVHLALQVRDFHYDHETGPAELSDMYPGLFPLYVRHPHKFAIAIVLPITLTIILLDVLFG